VERTQKEERMTVALGCCEDAEEQSEVAERLWEEL
jgi:hypothetical protein